MQVSLINRLDEFDALRSSWDGVFAADPHASVFVSWAWLRGWFQTSPHPWSVLAARKDANSPWLGFLPISVRQATIYRLDQVREIRMGGEPAADYTGFVCDPSHEKDIIAALADFMANEMPWDRLRLKEINDPRINQF